MKWQLQYQNNSNLPFEFFQIISLQWFYLHLWSTNTTITLLQWKWNITTSIYWLDFCIPFFFLRHMIRHLKSTYYSWSGFTKASYTDNKSLDLKWQFLYLQIKTRHNLMRVITSLELEISIKMINLVKALTYIAFNHIAQSVLFTFF